MSIGTVGGRSMSLHFAKAYFTSLSVAFALTGCGQAPTMPTAPPATEPASAITNAERTSLEVRPIPDGPLILRSGITVRRVIAAPESSIRMARDPLSGDLFVLNPSSGLYRLQLQPSAILTPAASVAAMVGDAQPSGMSFGPDGSLYVVANRTLTTRTQAVIMRGTPGSAGFTWAEVAHTVPYPRSNTPFDHLFNGIVVSPDGAWLYLNSGSRTDHGEVESNGGAFPDLRETAISSAILRIPSNASSLELLDDQAALASYLFADGTRNTYDLVFAPNGDLFGPDNGPDADFPDELNWLREGQHYGFPWRFGTEDNPQQFANYNGVTDKRLSQDFTAVRTGTYINDPKFPAAPRDFSDPIESSGPDAAQYRSADGAIKDVASDGGTIASFTPHRSPLGLVFADDPAMPADMRGDDAHLSAFVLSWGAAGGTLSDKGQDLLHLRLAKVDEQYTMTVTQLARDFKNPIDAVLVGSRLYVLEFGSKGVIWEVSFS